MKNRSRVGVYDEMILRIPCCYAECDLPCQLYWNHQHQKLNKIKDLAISEFNQLFRIFDLLTNQLLFLKAVFDLIYVVWELKLTILVTSSLHLRDMIRHSTLKLSRTCDCFNHGCQGYVF